MFATDLSIPLRRQSAHLWIILYLSFINLPLSRGMTQPSHMRKLVHNVSEIKGGLVGGILIVLLLNCEQH